MWADGCVCIRYTAPTLHFIQQSLFGVYREKVFGSQWNSAPLGEVAPVSSSPRKRWSPSSTASWLAGATTSAWGRCIGPHGSLDHYVFQRLRQWWRAKHAIRNWRDARFSGDYVYRQLGLARLRARPPRFVGEGVRLDPRAGCRKSARPVRWAGSGNGSMARLARPVPSNTGPLWYDGGNLWVGASSYLVEVVR